MRTRKPTVAEMREKRERQERENASRARQRAEIRRSRQSMGLDPHTSFMLKDWRGLGAPVDVTGSPEGVRRAPVQFRRSERGSLAWRGAEMRRKARNEHRKRSAKWETTRRELAAKGENTGTQANHNARRAKARQKRSPKSIAA